MNDDADLKAALATTEEARDHWHQKYTVEAQARKDETQVLGDALTALRQRHAEVAERLKAWARANNEEQKAGKLPTFLNPHTVLLWLGEAKARLT